MPVVNFDVQELQHLLGTDTSREELRRTIPRIGADLDDVEGDAWAVEFFPDRPDLFTVEGVARALRAYLEAEPGLSTYEVEDPTTHLTVDESVADVRPVIGAAILHDVELTEARLEGLIALQEDLHWGLGARRAKVAIGIHDLAPVEPPYVYRGAAPDEITFQPLQFPRELTLQEVLEEHPKGQEYAHLVEGHDRYPVILDAKDQLLSFPPVINGVLTEVTPDATDLLLDVTGTDAWAVERALNIVATSLAESGARIEAVGLEGGHRDATPNLEPQERVLDVADVHRLLGMGLGSGDVAGCLERMGHGAEPDGAEAVRVQVPPYRVDVLHDVDLVEDVAIGHGYDEVPSARPQEVTYGRPLASQRVAERVRRSLTGLGFLEAMTLNLTNPREQFENVGLEEEPAVTMLNPVSEEHTQLRTRVLPGLLHILRRNTHRDLPQRLFEVGVVTRPDGEGGVDQHQRVAGVVLRSEVGFHDAKSVVQALARDLGWDVDVEPEDHGTYLPGRCAALRVEGSRLGVFGEVHPRTLEAYGLEHPAVAFELQLPG